MTSIYQRALGADFARLHPRIQERFGLTSAGGRASRGRGVMEEVWRGRFYTLPFLLVGTWRNIMFPERGRFGYRGSFDCEWLATPDGPPASALPRREERRE